MSNPLHSPYYADQALSCTVPILENVEIARNTYRLRFESPQMSRRFLPGQFLMLRLAGLQDPLLGRPLALYDTVCTPDGTPWGIDVVYLVMGKMTTRLAEASPGDQLAVWGPLGNGFHPQPVDHLIMVAGGVGYTPFPAVAREHLGSRQYGEPARTTSNASRVSMCYGARSAEFLAGIENFSEIGVDLHLATDDGSRGHHGLVTDVLEQVLEQNGGDSRRILCCGPEPMMERVSEIAEQQQIDCVVSLETPMACGIGICFSCVAKVREEAGGWDYKRTCVDGPVFDARQIQW